MRVSLAVSPSSQCLAQWCMEPCSHDTSPPSTQCGDGGSGGQLLAGPLLDYTESLQRVTCTVIMGHQAGPLYRLLHPSSISIKTFLHSLSVSQITGENFVHLCNFNLLSEEHCSVSSHTETYCSTETTSKVCKSNTNMMLQPG